MIQTFIALQVWLALGVGLLFVMQTRWPRIITPLPAPHIAAIAFFWPAFALYFCLCAIADKSSMKRAAARQPAPGAWADGGESTGHKVKLN